MNSEKLENKAKPMKKRNVHKVHEHFEKALTLLSGFVALVQWSHLYTGFFLQRAAAFAFTS